MNDDSLTPEAIRLLNSLAAFTIAQQKNSKPPVMLADFTAEILKFYKTERSLSSHNVLKTALMHLDTYIGNISLTAIDVRTLDNFFIWLFGKAPRGTYNYYRTLKAAFNKAIAYGYINENPFTKIKLPKKQKSETVIISELQLILSKIKNPIIKDIIQILNNTGMRPIELMNLTWQDINLQKMIIQIGNESFKTKTRQVRLIPISKTVLNILERNRPKVLSIKAKKYFVFAKTNGYSFTVSYISKIFKSAVCSAGLDKRIHLYCLRGTYATRLLNAGVDIYTVKSLLGHSSIKTTESSYLHTTVEDLRNGISKAFDNY